MRQGEGFFADLEAMTDEELQATIDRYSVNVSFGLDFWVREMERRRSRVLLEELAQASKQTAEHLDELAALTEAQAKGNERAANLNRRMAWMTGASLLVAVIAAVAAIVAL